MKISSFPIRIPKWAAVSFPARRFAYAAAGITVGCAVIFAIKLPSSTYPVAAQSETAVPYEQGAPSETAQFLQDLRGMGIAALTLGTVRKPYLEGTGTIVAFSNDNIQIFEFSNPSIASAAAAQIFGKAPRLKKEPNFFHAYMKDALVILYFGHNQEVMQTMERITHIAAPQ